MRAWRVLRPIASGPLELRDEAVPEPGPDELLAAGRITGAAVLIP